MDRQHTSKRSDCTDYRWVSQNPDYLVQDVDYLDVRPECTSRSRPVRPGELEANGWGTYPAALVDYVTVEVRRPLPGMPIFHLTYLGHPKDYLGWRCHAEGLGLPIIDLGDCLSRHRLGHSPEEISLGLEEVRRGWELSQGVYDALLPLAHTYAAWWVAVIDMEAARGYKLWTPAEGGGL